MLIPPLCPYCHKQSVKITGNELYGNRKDTNKKLFWVCWDCQAWVGCHKGTETPLGTLANGELREMRSQVHWDFDQIWQLKHMTRTQAYEWLAEQMGISQEDCHVAMFDIVKCQQAQQILDKFWSDKYD